MFSARTLTLTSLFVLPLLVYLALGAYALWETGWFAYTFWILPVFWLITWVISVLWKTSQPLLRDVEPVPSHFTPRDEAAMQIVRCYQEQVDGLTSGQLSDPKFYLQQSQLLARDLAVHYFPNTSDPISSLTVPEVLAAVRLVMDDMERWMLESVPGSQLITVRQWKWLQHAPKWLKRAQNTAWVVGVLMNPANALKYLASEVIIDPISRDLQSELLAAVYLKFIRQAGFYLIEMNSGRLRGGADQYREFFRQQESTSRQSSHRPVSTLRPESLTVTLAGQVKAGKSSLVNALIGTQQARSDVLPATLQVERFRFEIPETDVQVTLLDTPGYADVGATQTQMNALQQAVQASDVLLLVMAANSPARAADRQMIDQLREWYANHPHLKPPPVVICLTHIDLLSPVMEWNPPYNWEVPNSKKEESVFYAVQHVREQFSDAVSDVVPLCTDVARGRQSDVVQELLPALLRVLSEGQMAAILRAYSLQLDRNRLQTFLSQLASSGKTLLQLWIDERLSFPKKQDQSASGR